MTKTVREELFNEEITHITSLNDLKNLIEEIEESTKGKGFDISEAELYFDTSDWGVDLVVSIDRPMTTPELEAEAKFKEEHERETKEAKRLGLTYYEYAVYKTAQAKLKKAEK